MNSSPQHDEKHSPLFGPILGHLEGVPVSSLAGARAAYERASAILEAFEDPRAETVRQHLANPGRMAFYPRTLRVSRTLGVCGQRGGGI